MVANLSRDVFIRQYDERKRPGTRHFVPGTKVWVLPSMWGDGGENVYVVGMRRQTGGRQLIRIVMPSARLVNIRLEAIYSPAVLRAMSGGTARAGEADRWLFDSKEQAERVARSWKWGTTRAVHLGLRFRHQMHNADEKCEFCDGRDAFRVGTPLGENPYEPDPQEELGTVAWWGSPHGFWAAGWRSEEQIDEWLDEGDLAVRLMAKSRQRLRDDARYLAASLHGRSVEEIEASNVWDGRVAKFRFVRGDYQPRPLDGIVHAWLDDNEVVVRTQFG